MHHTNQKDFALKYHQWHLHPLKRHETMSEEIRETTVRNELTHSYTSEDISHLQFDAWVPTPEILGFLSNSFVNIKRHVGRPAKENVGILGDLYSGVF